MNTKLNNALRAIDRLGEPGSAAAFVRALDAMFPATEQGSEHAPCPRCSCETHKNNIAKFGSCYRCYKGA